MRSPAKLRKRFFYFRISGKGITGGKSRFCPKFLSFYFKEPLAFSASHAEAGRPVARPPVRRSGVRSAVLPRLVPRHVAEEVLAEVFELRPYCARVKQEDPKVICGALLVVLARLLRARAFRGLGLGGDQEGKDAAVFSVACMIGSIEAAVMGTFP